MDDLPGFVDPERFLQMGEFLYAFRQAMVAAGFDEVTATTMTIEVMKSVIAAVNT
jgi:hypothetical protein